jgi:hypothetical protein
MNISFGYKLLVFRLMPAQDATSQQQATTVVFCATQAVFRKVRLSPDAAIHLYSAAV